MLQGQQGQLPPAQSAGGIQGSKISLISKSEIRYEGILYSINPEENTVALRNVRMFGTEGRKRDGAQIPPGDQLYEFIIFRGSDIKDLTVYDVTSPQPEAPKPQMPQDPAIMNAWPQSSQPLPHSDWPPLPQSGQNILPPQGSWGRNQNQQQRPPQWSAPLQNYGSQPPDRGGPRGWEDRRDYGRNYGGRGGFDSGNSGRGHYGYGYNRRGNFNQHTGQDFKPAEGASKPKEFSEDFDFESANKKLDLKEVAEELELKSNAAPPSASAFASAPAPASAAAAVEEEESKKAVPASTCYNKSSFFDEISCEALDRRGGPSEYPRMSREVRDHLRQTDIETFGNANVGFRGRGMGMGRGGMGGGGGFNRGRFNMGPRGYGGGRGFHD